MPKRKQPGLYPTPQKRAEWELRRYQMLELYKGGASDTPDRRERNETPTGGVMYGIRWSQDGFDGVKTGDENYDEAEAVRLCNKRNDRWRGQIEQWPVEFGVGKQGKRGREIRDRRDLVGLEELAE